MTPNKSQATRDGRSSSAFAVDIAGPAWLDVKHHAAKLFRESAVRLKNMKYKTSLIAFALLALAFAGCSKSSSHLSHVAPRITADLGTVELTPQTPKQFSLGAVKSLTLTGRQLPKSIKIDLVLLATNADGTVKRSESFLTTMPGQWSALSVGDEMIALTPTLKQQSADDKDTVLPGRHMSESQVADIAFRELPQGSHLQCEFKDGVWEILEVQPSVWGVSSVTTNADGKVFVSSTNATRVVLRVRDADGKVEQVKTP